MKTTKNTLVKAWFKSNYPNDNIFESMNSETTFEDLFRTLDRCKDVYSVIFNDGTMDSIVRDVVFDELANVMGVDVEYIFDQYNKCDNNCLSGLTQEQTKLLYEALGLI